MGGYEKAHPIRSGVGRFRVNAFGFPLLAVRLAGGGGFFEGDDGALGLLGAGRGKFDADEGDLPSDFGVAGRTGVRFVVQGDSRRSRGKRSAVADSLLGGLGRR